MTAPIKPQINLEWLRKHIPVFAEMEKRIPPKPQRNQPMEKTDEKNSNNWNHRP